MSKSWKTEVCVNGDWSSNSCRFATETEAINAGHELLSRWLAPTDSRAVESDGEVNYYFDKAEDRPRPIKKAGD